ncbi:MAG: 4-hydroxy-tetrahydrodipicolinate reductase [Desulfuromusa sp.]|nr:4-hydroxy-tetrahydrodipicolinate reductase [Desulfuromusa sp.]
MAISVCLAGATGWAGSALAKGIYAAPDLNLVSAVSRSHAGKSLGSVIDQTGSTPLLSSTAAEALRASPDVFIEYTKPDIAKSNSLQAFQSSCHVLVGTSGLNEDDYREIDAVAQSVGRGVLACGNFSLTAVLFEKFAEMAAKHIPHWEIIDYASSSKKDSPSGTARELAYNLSRVRESQLDVPHDQSQGPEGIRGARLNGTQVHAVRLPGYVLSLDAIFGMPDQKLIIRHEAGMSAQPYVDGALIGIRKVISLVGLHRGLASVMNL